MGGVDVMMGTGRGECGVVVWGACRGSEECGVMVGSVV